MGSVLKITWPEYLSWMTFGAFIYLLYGTTNSDAAKNSKNKIFFEEKNTRERGPRKPLKTEEFRNDCMMLSKRQRSLDDGSRVEDRNTYNKKKYNSLQHSKSIIKNYHPKQKEGSSENPEFLIESGSCINDPIHSN